MKPTCALVRSALSLSSLVTLTVLALALVALPSALLAEEEHETCYPVPEYDGINAIPAVTMQIYPSAHGDTVASDAVYPPGEGEKVVVGYWEFLGDPGDPESDDFKNPCGGEPLFKIVYPLDFGSKCFGWRHWVQEEKDGTTVIEPHPNSAHNFSCDEVGSFHLEQWVDTYDCVNDHVTAKPKTAFRTMCCLDTPSPSSRPGYEGPELPALYGQLMTGCGKEPPDVEPQQ